MTADRDTALLIRDWIRSDEHVSAQRLVSEVAARVPTAPQRRTWWDARRGSANIGSLRFASAVGVLLLAALALALYLGRPSQGPSATLPAVVPTSIQSPSATDQGIATPPATRLPTSSDAPATPAPAKTPLVPPSAVPGESQPPHEALAIRSGFWATDPTFQQAGDQFAYAVEVRNVDPSHMPRQLRGVPVYINFYEGSAFIGAVAHVVPVSYLEPGDAALIRGGFREGNPTRMEVFTVDSEWGDWLEYGSVYELRNTQTTADGSG